MLARRKTFAVDGLAPICRKRVTPQHLTRKARTLTDHLELKVLTEKEGGVCFRQLEAKLDYAGFFGKNPAFYNWVKGCFSITGTQNELKQPIGLILNDGGISS